MALLIPTELGSERIPKLLRQYAWPAIVAMTATSLYNMVDSIFIGQGAGKFAIAGLALTFPLMNLGMAFGTLVGVGATTSVSVLLGQKNYDVAQKVLGNVVTLSFIVSLGYVAAVLFFLDPILYFFGASDITIGYARDYMQIILLGTLVTHLYFGLNAVLRASGQPRKAMLNTILTVVLNVALDPLFIFVFGWGIRGAAVATILSQFVSLLLIIRIFSNSRYAVHFHSGIYRLRRRIVKDILSVGLSPFFMNSASCVIVIMINRGLSQYGGDLAIGAYGIINRIAFVVLMVVTGLNQGMQPIAGYNFGALQYRRVNEVLRLTIIWASVVTTAGFLLAECFPRQLAMAFTSDDSLLEISVHGMRTVFLFFPVIGFQMVTSNFFQSIGYAGKAIFLSLSRQLLLLLPLLIILPRIYGLDGVWYSMPVSDILASIIALFLLVSQYRKFNRHGESN